MKTFGRNRLVIAVLIGMGLMAAGNARAGSADQTGADTQDTSGADAGVITAAQAGLSGLVAPKAVNNDTITAKLRNIQLPGGETATVDLYGDGLLEVAVNPAIQAQLSVKSGGLPANGGNVQITAQTGAQLLNSLISVGKPPQALAELPH